VPGDRIFRDMTDEDRLETAKKRIEAFKGTEHYPTTTEKYNEILQGLITRYLPGEPISEIVK
jgi:hypothetical protein